MIAQSVILCVIIKDIFYTILTLYDIWQVGRQPKIICKKALYNIMTKNLLKKAINFMPDKKQDKL